MMVISPYEHSTRFLPGRLKGIKRDRLAECADRCLGGSITIPGRDRKLQ